MICYIWKYVTAGKFDKSLKSQHQAVESRSIPVITESQKKIGQFNDISFNDISYHISSKYQIPTSYSFKDIPHKTLKVRVTMSRSKVILRSRNDAHFTLPPPTSIPTKDQLPTPNGL